MAELRPCPLCGGKAKIYPEVRWQDVGWEDGLGSPGTMIWNSCSISCQSCGMSFSSEESLSKTTKELEESAIEKWNDAPRGIPE